MLGKTNAVGGSGMPKQKLVSGSITYSNTTYNINITNPFTKEKLKSVLLYANHITGKAGFIYYNNETGSGFSVYWNSYGIQIYPLSATITDTDISITTNQNAGNVTGTYTWEVVGYE